MKEWKTFVEFINEQEDEKWIPDDLKKGALHKALGIPEDEKIPMKVMKDKLKELKDKKEAREDKKYTPAELKLVKQINFALRAKEFNK